MNFFVILIAASMMAGLVMAAVLLWVGVNAILHGRGIKREAAMTIASLRSVLRSVYDDTVGAALPGDFLKLLRQLARHPSNRRRRPV